MSADAFHAALRDNPDDDVTRLVYADWLDDHGEGDRAQFVRLAVQMEQLRENDPNRLRLSGRYDDLRLTHGATWLGPRPASLQDVGYRGGLVSRLVFTSDATARDVESMLARHPASEVSIDGERTVKQLASSPALPMIRSLTIRRGMRKRKARLLDRLLEAPGLLGLRELSVAGDVVDGYLAQVIAHSAALRELHSLRLENTQLRDSGVRTLLRPEVLTKLTAWHVDCDAEASHLSRLFWPTHAPRWRELYWPRLTESSPTHLAGLRECVNLRRLHVVLPSMPMLPDGSARMGEWLAGVARLEDLCLEGRLSMGLANELASWPGLARLTRLRLSRQVYPSESDRIRWAIRQSPHYNRATRIELLA